MGLTIKHPANADIDVPLAIEAEGGDAIDAYVATECAARGLPWPPPAAPSPAPTDPPTPSPEG